MEDILRLVSKYFFFYILLIILCFATINLMQSSDHNSNEILANGLSVT